MSLQRQISSSGRRRESNVSIPRFTNPPFKNTLFTNPVHEIQYALPPSIPEMRPAISLVYLHVKWRLDLARAFLLQEILQRLCYLCVVWSPPLHSRVSLESTSMTGIVCAKTARAKGGGLPSGKFTKYAWIYGLAQHSVCHLESRDTPK